MHVFVLFLFCFFILYMFIIDSCHSMIDLSALGNSLISNSPTSTHPQQLTYMHVTNINSPT